MARHRKRDANKPPKEDAGGCEKKMTAKLHHTDNDYLSSMEKLLGFNPSELTQYSKLVGLMSRPSDPSSLAVLRVLYGLLMAMDIFQERGLANADSRFGDPEECRFPLFDFLQPLPLPWMYVVYLIMLCGCLGIMLGLLFKLSCLAFLLPYWYIFLLDKTSWNNHSYLYGLCALLFFLSDANRYWSIDALLWPKMANVDVPLWNYCLLRTQFFLVYFIAGLKKLDPDWLRGYSMQSLSHHWVFQPFTYVLTNDQIDLWIVHRAGFTLDLFVGFFMFFDATRPISFVFCGMFHCMNSQMFAIGMFPYVMLAFMPVFSYPDWPKKLIARMSSGVQNLLPSTEPTRPSDHCLYAKEVVKPEKSSSQGAKHGTVPRQHPTIFHKGAALLTVSYIATQCFMPYSHFLTPGFNNWTNGLYGYSWDMMVHTWSLQHMRLTYVDKDTGTSGFLKPDAWTHGQWRWSAHADMVKQYANCIQTRLRSHGLHNIQLYFDVWRSLNDRFQQRMYNPHVDILTAPWSAFRPVTWLLPLLVDLSEWRAKLDDIEKDVYNSSDHVDVVFMADFPGMVVDNFIQPELGNTSLQVLSGEVVVELSDRAANITLGAGQSAQIPSGEYHKVHTVSSTPSSFFYLYVNTTEMRMNTELHQYEQKLSQGKAVPSDPSMQALYQEVKERKEQIDVVANSTVWQRVQKFFFNKYKQVARGLTMTGIALQSIITDQDFETVFNATVGAEEDRKT